MSNPLEPMIVLRDAGEFQVWHSVLLARLGPPSGVGIGEAIADADNVIRAVRMRVPTLKIPEAKLNS